jgi:signal transduction histidine kinase
VQEAIANTVQHARAQALRVGLSYRHQGVRIAIVDDGDGFVVDPELRAFGGHWGLLGLRERAAQVGGRVTIRSVLDCGTAVVLRVPYAAADSR